MFLHRCVVLVIFVLLLPSMSSAEELVPQSTSPNGKFAISYESAPASVGDEEPKVWFINLRTQRHISVQLVPSSATIEKAAYRNHRKWALEDDRQMLWETLVEGMEDEQQGQRGAVNTSVVWTTNSQQVTVRINHHKFTHSSVFELHHGQFRYVRDGNQ